MGTKIKVATASLAGCFGCHMSLLDIDLRILDLVERVEFDRCPLTDIKTIGPCDLGIIEGGVANAENVAVLQAFRRQCRVLVAVGACALDGGVPSLRNQYDVAACLAESYVDGVGLRNPGIPNDPEIPLLLDRVRPVAQVVKIDHFLPGCPPSADVIWAFLQDFLAGRPIRIPSAKIRYD